MQYASLENIYREIVLLPDTERDMLYDRIKKNFYQNSEIIAYTTNGEALTIEQYRKRINIGINQCIRGESVALEDLTEELGYIYADL
jgi:anionic cell wall polymer biosynthesis LytR-Cps2A-Psr (LCP) family protein